VRGGRRIEGTQPTPQGVDQTELDGVDRVVVQIVESEADRIARDLVGERHG
jgi:hypothetical protein